MIGNTFSGPEELSKLGFRLSGFLKWPLEKSIKCLAEAGYKSLDLCLGHPDMNPDKLSSAGISKIRKIIEANEMRISAVSYRGKNEDVDAALKKQRKGLGIAAELGSRILLVGTASEALDPDGQRTFRALEELLSEAESSGLTVAVEPEPETVLNGMYEFSMLASHVAGAPLGLNLNVAHAALTEGDVPAVIEEWAPFIVHAHISDVKKHEHAHLLPGDGHLDLCKVIMTLRENNYHGDLVLDLSETTEAPDQLAKKAMERFREILT